MRSLAIAAVTALVLATASAAVERLSPEEARARIQTLVEEALAGRAVGLSVALAYDGNILLEEGYGTIEVEHDVATNAESIFRIGSITKQFTAALVMKQVESGKIGLDDPISKFVDYPTQGKEVTVRHLLTHTSGIKSYTGLGAEWIKTVPLEMTHEELLGLVDDLPFDFDPGTKYRYNNTGYYLLGVILEEVSGKSFAELLAEEITDPLELTRTRYGSNGDIIRNRAQGYEFRNGELANDDLIGMSQPGAAGAMLSTAGDLLRWQRALRAGQVVSAKSYEQMITPYTLSDGESTDYGFGLSMDEADGLRRVQHGGGINGFNSMLAHFPDTGVGVAVISNSNGFRASNLARDIARAVHDREVEISDLPVPPAEQKRLGGTYAFDELPMEITIVGRDDQLFAQPTGQAEDRLLRQAEGRYRASFDKEVKVDFAEGSPSPTLTLQQGGGTYVAKRKSDG
ncbi:MAG: serine hydrolase domain-containing protein [Acidobacteriota bacterium]